MKKTHLRHESLGKSNLEHVRRLEVEQEGKKRSPPEDVNSSSDVVASQPSQHRTTHVADDQLHSQTKPASAFNQTETNHRDAEFYKRKYARVWRTRAPNKKIHLMRYIRMYVFCFVFFFFKFFFFSPEM